MSKFKPVSFSNFLLLEPVGKLDFILNYLDHDKKQEKVSEISTSLWGNVPTSNLKMQKEIVLVLNRLNKDGYVLKSETTPPYYIISFDGKLLNNQNGYGQLERNKILAFKKQSVDIKVAKRSNIVLAIATVVLALDAIIRIGSFVHQHFCK